MSLPATLRVRISPETAEAIGLSAVVAQDLSLSEMLSNILGITGKDPERIAGVLRRGGLVVGASRFRWEPCAVEASDVEPLLGAFPDSEPGRPFAAERCIEATFREGPAAVSLAREAGEKRRFLKRRDFWTELMQAVQNPAYVHYSYREKADLYRWKPGIAELRSLQDASALLAYSSLERRLRSMSFSSVDLLVRR
ncbi:MAG TPA: hypothetical protein VES20_15045 [Bryobacteraceae bacterium]|nr:hypothetical protein [Bryobacteraceae bacterium]